MEDAMAFKKHDGNDNTPRTNTPRGAPSKDRGTRHTDRNRGPDRIDDRPHQIERHHPTLTHMFNDRNYRRRLPSRDAQDECLVADMLELDRNGRSLVLRVVMMTARDEKAGCGYKAWRCFDPFSQDEDRRWVQAGVLVLLVFEDGRWQKITNYKVMFSFGIDSRAFARWFRGADTYLEVNRGTVEEPDARPMPYKHWLADGGREMPPDSLRPHWTYGRAEGGNSWLISGRQPDGLWEPLSWHEPEEVVDAVRQNSRMLVDTFQLNTGSEEFDPIARRAASNARVLGLGEIHNAWEATDRDRLFTTDGHVEVVELPGDRYPDISIKGVTGMWLRAAPKEKTGPQQYTEIVLSAHTDVGRRKVHVLEGMLNHLESHPSVRRNRKGDRLARLGERKWESREAEADQVIVGCAGTRIPDAAIARLLFLPVPEFPEQREVGKTFIDHWVNFLLTGEGEERVYPLPPLAD